MACSFSVASWMWYIYFNWGLFEMRVLMRGYKLAMAAWQDVKALVMNPQAVVAGAALVRGQLPRAEAAQQYACCQCCALQDASLY